MRHMTMGDRNIMVARVLREFEIVRNHRRGAPRPLHLERRADEAPALRILPRGGLVQHQKERPRGERRRDREPSLQLRCEIAWMLALAASQAYHEQCLSRLCERQRTTRAQGTRPERRFLEHRAREKLASRILKDEASHARALVHRQRCHICRSNPDVPRASWHEPHDRSGKSALPRAIPADPRDDLARVDRQRERIEYYVLAVAGAERFDTEHGFGVDCSRAPPARRAIAGAE